MNWRTDQSGPHWGASVFFQCFLDYYIFFFKGGGLIKKGVAVRAARTGFFKGVGVSGEFLVGGGNPLPKVFLENPFFDIPFNREKTNSTNKFRCLGPS